MGDQANELRATYHFTFTGAEQLRGTVSIRGKVLESKREHSGNPDVRITADARTWVQVVNGERGFLWAVLSRKVKVKGPFSLMKAFTRCFPA